MLLHTMLAATLMSDCRLMRALLRCMMPARLHVLMIAVLLRCCLMLWQVA